MSLGRAWAGHSLQAKLAAAHDAGFLGVEVFYEDLEHLASTSPGGVNEDNLIAAATTFKSLAGEHHLSIICLQPFMHFEGHISEDDQRQKWTTLQQWFRLVQVLKTDIIQVPSNFLNKGITGDWTRIVSDLQQLADAGLKQTPPVRFAYEGICWGRFVDTWKQAWDIILAVDRPNFGLCLDLFHLVGREWADPAAEDGKVSQEADAQLRQSLREMVKVIDVDKVYYVQVANAKKATPPIRPGHPWWDDEQPARMTWSRNMRVFPFEEGGYMPETEPLQSVLALPPAGLGYRGWVSLELFSTTMADKGSVVPLQHAMRGIRSWHAIKSTFDL